jgi:leader peptidase (prepilin peptidase)/N-methyltransferase
MAAFAIVAGLVGASVGSFLNVVAYRLPRKEGLLRSRSRCPSCERPIRPLDNIPVFSWLALRGRCRSCGARISARYPIVEAATAGLFVAVVLVRGAGPEGWLALALVALLVPVALIDLEHRVIPNRLLLPAALAALPLVALAGPERLPEHLIAGSAAFAALLLAALAYPAGMGMGDVKLAGVMGLYLGAAIAPAMLVAFGAGTLVGLAMMAREGAGARKRAVPFGPFLALGGLVGLLVGPELIDLYKDNFLS